MCSLRTPVIKRVPRGGRLDPARRPPPLSLDHEYEPPLALSYKCPLVHVLVFVLVLVLDRALRSDLSSLGGVSAALFRVRVPLR